MKSIKTLVAICAAILITAALGHAGYTTVLTYSGDPNGTLSAEAGSVCSDTSAGTIWVKTGTTATTGWKAIKTAALGNAVSGTLTLTSGTGAIAVVGSTTNSVAYVTGRGITNAGTLGVTMTSGTLSVASSSGSDARVVNYLVITP